jgi:hypothetical protein
VKRIVLLLQAFTCLVVITVNGIVLYQFLRRSGCTAFQLDFANSDNLKQSALGFGDCVRRAVNQEDVPKPTPSHEAVPASEPSPSRI